MDCINVEDFGRADNRGNVEIALSRRRGPDAGRLIGKAHVQRIAIDVAVHGDGADAHLLARPDYSAGDLATVGDQNLAKSSWTVVHNIANLQLPISDWPLRPQARSSNWQ